MLESTSDSWADSRPEVGAEYLGVCHYCESPIFKDEEWTTEDNQTVHLDCQDNDYYDSCYNAFPPEDDKNIITGEYDEE